MADYYISESTEKNEILDRIYRPALDVFYFFRDEQNNGFTYKFLLKTLNFPYFIAINDRVGFYEEYEEVILSKLMDSTERVNKYIKIFKVNHNEDLTLLMPYILYSITNGSYGVVCDCKEKNDLYKIISYNLEYHKDLQHFRDLDPQASIYLLSDVGITIHTNNTDLSDVSGLKKLLT